MKVRICKKCGEVYSGVYECPPCHRKRSNEYVANVRKKRQADYNEYMKHLMARLYEEPWHRHAKKESSRAYTRTKVATKNIPPDL